MINLTAAARSQQVRRERINCKHDHAETGFLGQEGGGAGRFDEGVARDVI